MKKSAVVPGGARFRSSLLSLVAIGVFAVGAVISLPAVCLADETGVSFWLPGLFGSLAAVPQQPGWSLMLINYYDSVGASGSVAVAHEIRIGKFNQTVSVNPNVNLNAKIDAGLINPSYVFATPVLGGQLSLGMMGIVEYNDTALNGALTLSSGRSRHFQARQHQSNHNGLWRFVPASNHSLEQRFEQLDGLRHRRYSCRRL